MKYITLLFSVVFLFGACNETSSKTKDTAEIVNADMLFEKGTEHDFGEIPYKGNGEFEFKFKNTGTDPLIITKVQSSCGCTTPEYSKEPVKPGKEGIIKVEYDTKRVGPFKKSVKVYANIKNSPVKLIIKGEVVKKENNEEENS